MSEYDEQAKRFTDATGLKITKVYEGHRKYFLDDKEPRAVWSITFEREGRQPYTFKYGDSVVNSYRITEPVGFYKRREIPWTRAASYRCVNEWLRAGGGGNDAITVVPQHPEPSDYDLLSCIEKGEPDSFEGFCGDYGYDTDSIKARDTWQAVVAQQVAIRRMFTDAEIEQLQGIN